MNIRTWVENCIGDGSRISFVRHGTEPHSCWVLFRDSKDHAIAELHIKATEIDNMIKLLTDMAKSIKPKVDDDAQFI